jgi:hypothetical protein
VKKTIIAALASLMLAGAISAASDVAKNPTTRVIVLVGDGSAPIPPDGASAIEPSDQASLSK